MKIYKIQNNISTKNSISFKGKDKEININNIDDYLQHQDLSLQKSYTDLIKMNGAALNEKTNLLHAKRNLKEQEELSRVKWNNPIDFYKKFDDSKFYERIINSQNVLKNGLLKYISADEMNDYKRGADFFAKDVPHADFKNTIVPLELDYNVKIGNISDIATKQISKLFLSFKNDDTKVLKNSLNAFSLISNNYFKHASNRITKIKNLYKTKERWIERVPVGGVVPRFLRVSNQQQNVACIYDDYSEYCDKFIHNGIRPIVISYIKKVKQMNKYVEYMKPNLSNSDIDFANTANLKMEEIATPILEKYINILSNVTLNGENIAKFHKAINTNGDIAMIIKAIATISIILA